MEGVGNLSSNTSSFDSPSTDIPTPKSTSLTDRHYLKSIRVSSSTKDSFTLDWQVLPEFEPRVEGFKIRYRASGSGIIQKSKKLNGRSRTLNIGHLHENTEYEVCLWTLFTSSPSAILTSIRVIKNLTSGEHSHEPRGTVMGSDDYIGDEEFSPHCIRAFTGYNAAWVALGSALAATIVIGLIVFVVCLASRQSSNKEEEEEKKDEVSQRSSDGERIRKKRKWWMVGKFRGKCLLHKDGDGGTLKRGFLTGLKRRKRRKGFRIKNQLQSSKSALGCEIEDKQAAPDQSLFCSCDQRHSKSKKGRQEGTQDDNSSVHSSLLSLIQDEPGNCYLVATSLEEEKSGSDQMTHELAYLIPIMKCQDGTLVLGSDPTDAEAFLELPEEIEDEAETEQNGVGEPFDGDFDLLSVVFHPECCVSVVDSLYVGDILSIHDESSISPGNSEENGEASDHQSFAPEPSFSEVFISKTNV